MNAEKSFGVALAVLGAVIVAYTLVLLVVPGSDTIIFQGNIARLAKRVYLVGMVAVVPVGDTPAITFYFLLGVIVGLAGLLVLDVGIISTLTIGLFAAGLLSFVVGVCSLGSLTVEYIMVKSGVFWNIASTAEPSPWFWIEIIFSTALVTGPILLFWKATKEMKRELCESFDEFLG